jgi:hypothetical protein
VHRDGDALLPGQGGHLAVQAVGDTGLSTV